MVWNHVQQARDVTAEVLLTPEMIEAGVVAYSLHAAHNKMSFCTPEATVCAIILAALSRSNEASPPHPMLRPRRQHL